MSNLVSTGLPAILRTNPAGWPEDVLPLFDRARTVEYVSLTKTGTPIMVPTTPYIGEEGGTLDVSTGLAYPTKAERARRTPRVCLLYADGIGSGLSAPPVVLVQGLAAVRDADLQANTDRYVRLSLVKTPEAFKGQPSFLMRRLNWYFARIWIQVTPVRITWWPEGRLDRAPRVWDAPADRAAPPSDPRPRGPQPPAWLDQPANWRAGARHALAHLPLRDLAWTGTDGFPVAVPVSDVAADPRGFRVRLAAGLPAPPAGPACLTLHTHPEAFTGQENRTFIGDVVATDDGVLFRVERLLADWSLAGSKLVMTLGFLTKGRRLAPRVRSEAARRGQPVPQVRLPGAALRR